MSTHRVGAQTSAIPLLKRVRPTRLQRKSEGVVQCVRLWGPLKRFTAAPYRMRHTGSARSKSPIRPADFAPSRTVLPMSASIHWTGIRHRITEQAHTRRSSMRARRRSVGPDKKCVGSCGCPIEDALGFSLRRCRCRHRCHRAQSRIDHCMWMRCLPLGSLPAS